jgi:hypothetical protein
MKAQDLARVTRHQIATAHEVADHPWAKVAVLGSTDISDIVRSVHWRVWRLQYDRWKG